MIPGKYSIRINDRYHEIVTTKKFEFSPGKINFLFGESGIGKTLLSKAVYGLLDPGQLYVSLNSENYRSYLRKDVTRDLKKNSFFVFQEPSSHLNPMMSVRDQLEEGSLGNLKDASPIFDHLWHGAGKDDVNRILDTYPKPYRPSGGEKQRILLAMAFKKIQLLPKDKSSFFVFDEPTGNLDNRYRNLVLDLIYKFYKSKQFTLLFITHDYSIINEIYNRHREFLPFTRFSELYRKDDSSVAIRNFSAEKYLQWEQSISHRKPVKKAAEPLLAVKNEILVFDRILHIFSDQNHRRPADLLIYPGTFTYLKAPSGTGKTTLAKIVMGLIKPKKFNARLGKKVLNQATPIQYWRKKVWGKQAGMVFQHADESLDLQANIYQSFSALPLKEKYPPKKLAAFLDQVFVEKVDQKFLKIKMDNLSGGQKQRINILRSLILNTDLVILDEPLNGLDFHSIQKVLHLLEEKRAQGTAFLIISHNEDLFEKLTPKNNIYYLA